MEFWVKKKKSSTNKTLIFNNWILQFLEINLFGYSFWTLFLLLENKKNKENTKNTFGSSAVLFLKNAENMENTKFRE